MDPMDYSMEDADPAQPSSSSALRCQYQHQHQHQHPHPPAGEGSFSNSPPARDAHAHHYDPIHNTDSWYQIDSSAGPARARPLPSFGQWLPPQFGPPSSWHPLGDGHARLRGDVADSGQPAAFMAAAHQTWNEMHGYDSPQFGPSQFTSLASRGAAQVGPPTARAFTSSAVASQNPVSQNPASQNPPVASSNASVPQPSYPRRDSRSDPQSPPSNTHPDGQFTLMAMRMRDAQLARAERRGALHSQLAQSFGGSEQPRPNNSEDRSLGRRRAAPTWESDDEDDEALADSEDAGHRRHSELFGDQDDERTLAAIRGSIAAAKKIPSKEALASLERIDLKDLKDSEKVCTICYNDIGVENPDGVIENPIRLPKCKHIFGEKCIKKWFQDSDTCPYCRDKLPSELSLRKSAAFESLRARQDRLVAITASTYHAYRARQHGFPQRYPSNEELSAQDRNVIRYTQEEYHYIMTGSQSAESWSYTAHNRVPHRESPERRRQGRGRASLNRPISVGSARFVAPTAPIMNHHSPSHRPHLGLGTPTAPSSTPHRSSSPTPIQPGPEASSSHNTASSFSGRPSGTAVSAEEPSPSVAVGSGVGPSERSSSLGNLHHAQAPYFDHSNEGWYDMFPSQSGRTSLPPIANYRPRPMGDSSALPPLFHEHMSDAFGGAATNQGFPTGQGDGSRDGTYGPLPTNRWSAQFPN